MPPRKQLPQTKVVCPTTLHPQDDIRRTGGKLVGCGYHYVPELKNGWLTCPNCGLSVDTTQENIYAN